MVVCLFCNRNYKSKNAYKSHTESQIHKENEKNVKSDLSKYRKLFVSNFCTFVQRYNDYKLLTDVYKAYIKNTIISFRDVGYKNLESLVQDVIEQIDVKRFDDMWYVKSFDRFIPSSNQKNEFEESEELSLEEEGNVEIDNFEIYEGDIAGLEEFIESRINFN